MNRTELERRARLWQRHRAIRAAWFGGAAGLAAACLIVRASAPGAALLATAVLAGVFTFLRRRVSPATAAMVAAHLNRLCPALEESATLWLREADALTLLERLQLRRLNAAWETLSDRATLGCPQASALRPAAALGTAALIALTIVVSWPHAGGPAALAASATPAATVEAPLIPVLRSTVLEITPPAYLGGATRRVAGFDAEVAEGSSVTWEIEISGAIAGLSLQGANAAEHVPAEALGDGRFSARTTVVDTRVYQVAVTRVDGGRAVWSEIHTLKVIRDQPPRLTWQAPALRRTIFDPAKERALVSVLLGATDDHGIAAVKLVMTVAKGSGEGVKFREQEIVLEATRDAAAGGATHERTLDLAALGLEPGDELYFHAVATDKRTPVPNRARSETRFVVLRGPATELPEPGLAIAGINRVPQYFRSQRQLILDTERLLVERPTLTDATFRERSEDIGIDQKLLRLRYGQFLGEEFEPTSAGAPKEAQAMAAAGVLRGQPREAASRAAAVERAVEAQHVHPTAANRDGRPPTAQEIMAPFVHQHDNAEAATLFDAQVKASLRGVLAAMWDAEGFLRTGRPEDALPAENRALELLKALQQADRVYVKRVGYEAAPLKEAERRLRGELDAIPKRTQSAVPMPALNPDSDALQAALADLGAFAGASLTDSGAAIVDTQLVTVAQGQPERFVAALELWRRRSAGLNAGERETLLKAVWSLLSPAQEMPQRPTESAPALARDYFEALRAVTEGPR
ncbi:MAG: hypothetical protein EXS37_15200 [Opitutus sp.]|nr:hypothetical protein [Opitutus sp.]